jgi:hypothetical protein
MSARSICARDGGEDVDRLAGCSGSIRGQAQFFQAESSREFVIEVVEGELRIQVSAGDELELLADPVFQRTGPVAAGHPQQAGDRREDQ